MTIWEGLSAEYGAVFLVGYHGRAGGHNIMSHVFSDIICDVRINGRSVGEGALAAGLAGTYGIPTIMVAGTDAACAEMQEWCPAIEVAVTKVSISRYATRCVPVKESRAKIQEAARRAVAGLADHQPLKIRPPIALEVVWRNHQTVAIVAMMPGVEHDGDRMPRFIGDDFAEVDRAFKAMFYIAISPGNPGFPQVP